MELNVYALTSNKGVLNEVVTVNRGFPIYPMDNRTTLLIITIIRERYSDEDLGEIIINTILIN